ncbi:YdcF family protein [Microvirga mediterraneensis]|uniref:YdcF family protein n=1 Tax=Microvirga mediterraneensis TaxID=2754695 RepID=A0A838BP38_9HYPH|nr:YdcF family protein [Microvirga mediterraneensis]MBA1157208.1 YdcF family protein [Microvirga mediterraneensis]
MTSRTQSWVAPGAVDSTEAVGWGWTMPASTRPPVRRSLTSRLLKLGFWSFIAALVVSFLGFLGFVYSLDRFEQPPETRADGIVAMTGGAQRIGDAIDLLAKGYAKRLLISGVNENTSRDQIARLNPGQRRFFDCCVDLDYRARNTIGNAIETRRWAEANGFDTIIVVTSNYHMPRTLVELEHALPNLQKIPYPVAATIDPHEWWHKPAVARLVFTEYVKFLAVWIRTRFEDDPERSSVAKIISGGAPIKAQIVADPLWR